MTDSKKKSKSTKLRKILVINGVNLDRLGKREPELYGNQTLAELEAAIHKELPKLEKRFSLEIKLVYFQTNSESEFLEKLTSKNWDGILLNPGAWTHTSIAIYDRLLSLSCPVVEVHLTNLFSRDEIRQRGLTSAGADMVFMGGGTATYLSGLYALLLSV